MERMTYRLEDQYGNQTDKIILETDYICMSTPKKLEVVLSRLAAYEDTGLEPETVEHLKLASMGKAIAEITEFEGIPIDRLRELAQADRDGRCVVLPCKIGDTIYQVDYMTHGEALRAGVPEKNDPQSKRKFGRRKAKYLPLMVREKKMVKSLYSEFGKSVFLTRAEAEAALRMEQE